MQMTQADTQTTVENIKYVLSHDFSQANKEEALQLLQMMTQGK